jgi:hypothetical protein
VEELAEARAAHLTVELPALNFAEIEAELPLAGSGHALGLMDPSDHGLGGEVPDELANADECLPRERVLPLLRDRDLIRRGR